MKGSKTTEEMNDLLKDINPSEGVDVSTVMPEIMPGRYFAFRKGGPHFFGGCKDKSVVEDIYLQNIWPFIYTVTNNTSRISTGTISKSKLSYVVLRLYHKSETKIKRNFRKITGVNELLIPREVDRGMHKVMALCFVPNLDKEKNTLVDHINGNRVDYRIENLRWTTLEGNSKGNGGEKSDPDKVYELISHQLWFQGLGTNTIKTPKDKHFEYIANEENIKKERFIKDFEEKLKKEN
tara:strand:+ start:734 stop:1444 length:711 start_codon:yes stop_codon:yes gene_type:complete